jgi:hypothetical protein
MLPGRRPVVGEQQMRTPAGTECRYYYEDFNRGRAVQECRLIAQNRRSLPWTPDTCAKCPVPAILRANGSPDLRLELTVSKRLGLWRHLEVSAYCLRHLADVPDPMRGCPACAAEAAAEPIDPPRGRAL